MNRLVCGLKDDFSFIKSIVDNKIQFDIYQNHSTHSMAFVYVNPETGCLKEIVHGQEDEYFHQTIETISSYFATHKTIKSYLELCRKLEKEEVKNIKEKLNGTSI